MNRAQRNPRLIYVSHSAALAGAERSLLAHAASFSRQGLTVIVTVPRKGPLRSQVQALGIRCQVVPTPLWMSARAKGFVGFGRLLLCMLSVPIWVVALLCWRPDAVLTNSAVVPSAAIAARLAAIPHACFIRESVLTNPTLQCPVGRRRALRLLSRLSKQVFVVSEYVRQQWLAATGRGSGVTVVSPPILFEGIAREANPLKENVPRVAALFAGAFTADKGLDDALRAVSMVDDGLGLHLYIAGGGSPASYARAQARTVELGIDDVVEFLGWVNDLNCIVQEASVLIMPSRNEAFGRVTVEALAAGVPVIAYDTGGSSEILARGGGILVEPKAEALADAIEIFASSPGLRAKLAAETRDAASPYLGASERLDRFSKEFILMLCRR